MTGLIFLTAIVAILTYLTLAGKSSSPKPMSMWRDHNGELAMKFQGQNKRKVKEYV